MVQGSAPAHAPGLQVPAYRAGGQPGTVLLTENMLRDALANGELVVQQADGKRFRVRMVRGQDEPNGRWSVNAFHYDNLGNKRAVREQQWSWATRFTNLGAVFNADERTNPDHLPLQVSADHALRERRDERRLRRGQWSIRNDADVRSSGETVSFREQV